MSARYSTYCIQSLQSWPVQCFHRSGAGSDWGSGGVYTITVDLISEWILKSELDTQFNVYNHYRADLLEWNLKRQYVFKMYLESELAPESTVCNEYGAELSECFARGGAGRDLWGLIQKCQQFFRMHSENSARSSSYCAQRMWSWLVRMFRPWRSRQRFLRINSETSATLENKSWKVSSILNLLYTITIKLTFENVEQAVTEGAVGVEEVRISENSAHY